MARPLKPLVHSGGWYPSKKWIPLVRNGGYTTANGGEQPEPEAVLKTVTGSLIHITDALALPAEALTVNVEPIQDLHGYDSPWPAGGGKNKFDVEALPTGTDQGVFKLPDGSIKVVAPSSSGGVAPYKGGYMKLSDVAPTLAVGQTYTLSFISTGTQKHVYLATSQFVWANGSARTITQNDLDSIIYFYASGAGTEAIITNFQIELGSTPTAWTPYSNICPISGRTSATVTRTGKNLFNPRLYLGGRYNPPVGSRFTLTNSPEQFTPNADSTAFTITLGPTWAYRTVLIPVENFDTLYLSYKFESTGQGGRSWGYLDKDFTVMNVVNSTDASTTYNSTWFPYSYTNVSYIYIVFTNRGTANATLTLTNPSCTIGSTASAYEHYQGNTYTIQLGDTVYGGTLDVTGGKMVVDRRMLDMSAVTYAVQKYSGYNAARFGHGSTDINKTRLSILSNTFTAVANNVTLADRPMWAYTYTSGNYYPAEVKVPSEYDTSAKLRAFFADIDGNGTKAVILLQMATPIEITLTPTQIDMLLGENNLWADAGDLTLTYYADGNASTSEALGILLGGTYNNPGGADDVSDDEALGILLGGS